MGDYDCIVFNLVMEVRYSVQTDQKLLCVCAPRR